jgi:predicted amidohydrolase
MSTLKVSLLQLRSQGLDVDAAVRVGDAAVREAAAAGADIAVFPELWQVGYTPCPDDAEGRQAWQGRAERPDGPFVTHFAALARELGLAIVITYLQEWEGAPRNAATLIDRHGDAVLTYAKVHTCDFWMEAALTPGDDLGVVSLDTAGGPVNVGLMICFDREFPEAARVLALDGAELILTPNCCFLNEDRLGQFRARAFENMLSVAMANYARPAGADPDDEIECNGRSVAYSGIAFSRDGRGLDHTLTLAGEDEGVHTATIDLDALRDFRSREVWGDAYRKPEAYRRLLEDRPMSVFVRANSRRVAGQPAAG